ncbi:hypothetical protein [uncultured Rikenella sp.]|uniref:hypothetical protein n=1 Tax=uncultured Rikenella sp. TaxID=368003 RepID=UPI002633A13F|nr:hypothetical protein [uncultured Rikenella sp.]
MIGKSIFVTLGTLLALTACKKEISTPEQAAAGFGEPSMLVEVHPNTTTLDIPVVFPPSENGWMSFVVEVDYATSWSAAYGEQFEFPTLVKQDDRNFGFLAPDLKPDVDMNASIPMTIHPDKITNLTQIVLQVSYGLPKYRQLVIRLMPAAGAAE